ncbi:hypothetical protein NUACC21_77910 [Scytonema sp. NUACC21]
MHNDYSGTSTLEFSTITLNSAANGSGVYKENVVSPFSSGGPGSVNTRNTIIALHIKSTDGVNSEVFGSFNSFGYNLIGDSTGSTGFSATGDIVGTSDSPIDPRLGALGFYGGSTQTIALLPDSPAIDAGDPNLVETDPKTDQRGFPRVSGERVDKTDTFTFTKIGYNENKRSFDFGGSPVNYSC